MKGIQSWKLSSDESYNSQKSDDLWHFASCDVSSNFLGPWNRVFFWMALFKELFLELFLWNPFLKVPKKHFKKHLWQVGTCLVRFVNHCLTGQAPLPPPHFVLELGIGQGVSINVWPVKDHYHHPTLYSYLIIVTNASNDVSVKFFKWEEFFFHTERDTPLCNHECSFYSTHGV